MAEQITAVEANRSFSTLLREVGQGREFVVTNHGRPVALVTATAHFRASRDAARSALFARLAAQPIRNAGEWSRDDLYDESAADADRSQGVDR